VQRGFYQSELLAPAQTVLQHDQGWRYHIEWQWAFRWLLTAIKTNPDD
jgi:hypothetical protein